MNRNIDLDELAEISHLGIKRAATFMGFGLNSADCEDMKDFTLSKYTYLDFLPDSISPEYVKHYKEEFKIWMITCGLRELIETFSVYLDKVYETCMYIQYLKGSRSTEEISKCMNNMEHSGLNRKFKLLNDTFNIKTQYLDHLISVNEIRHCLTHYRGIVPERDGVNGMKLTWIGFQVILERLSGEEVKLPYPLPDGGMHAKDGEQIHMKQLDKRVIFRVNERIVLPVDVLAEICGMMKIITDEIKVQTLVWIKNQNVTIKEKKIKYQ